MEIFGLHFYHFSSLYLWRFYSSIMDLLLDLFVTFLWYCIVSCHHTSLGVGVYF